MKRILVADDSVTIQKVIALTFADEPFEVQSAGTGAEALEKMKQWRPDIVLADVIMPQMNGYELCRTIKQQDTTREIPVLLLAGTFEAFDQGEANSSGANDYITKPFESAELIEKVKALTAGLPHRAAQAGAPAAGKKPAARVQTPSAAPQAPHPQPPAAPASEPDIWDLLGDTGPESSPGESGTPAFVMSQETGVVDVGSFEVSLDRIEETIPQPPSPPSAAPQKPSVPPAPSVAVGGPQSPQAPAPKPAAARPPSAQPSPPRTPGTAPPAPSAPQAQAPKPAAQPPKAVPPPPAHPSPPRAPQAAAPTPMAPPAPQASKVERRERDFFGFDTELEEGLAELQVPEGIEELSFDLEEPKAIVEEEVSFIVPEPVEPGPLTTGETVSIDLMTVPEMASEPAMVQFEEPAALMDELRGIEEGDFEEAELPPLPEAAAPFQETATVIEELKAEPPKVSPPPAPSPQSAAAVQPPPSGGAVGAGDVPGIAMDETMWKLIEEKVEKIVWEVVPEMAEVIIREAIEKIKSGT